MLSKLELHKIKELRAWTGARLAACRDALEKSDWDTYAARSLLDRSPVGSVDRAEKGVSHGRVSSYVHLAKIIGCVEVRCETDFCARSEPFVKFCDELAMQVAASDMPCTVRFCDENHEGEPLLDRPSIFDASKRVRDELEALKSRVQENVKIARYVRMELGV